MKLARIWPWLKWSVLGLFLLLTVVIASISAVVATEAGSRWAVGLAGKYLPLEFGAINGNLLTGLDLESIDYRLEEDGALQQHYRAEHVSFRWQPLALFYSAVSVQSLKAEHIRLLLPVADETESAPFAWPSFALPVRIELGELQLTDIEVLRQQIKAPPEALVNLQRVSSSSISLGTFNFRLKDLVVVTEQLSVITSGRVALRYPYDANLAVQWQFELPPSAEQSEPLLFYGQGELSGDIETVALNHQLLAPFAITSNAQLNPNLSHPPAMVAPTAEPRLAVTNQWETQALLARWFGVDATIPQVGGELQVQGWLSDYQAQLTAELHYGDLPTFAVQAKTQGDLSQLHIQELLLTPQPVAGQSSLAQSSKLQLGVDGRVQWSPSVHWDLTLKGKDLDPKFYLPDWPGQLQLTAKTQGDYDQNGLRMTVDDVLLAGQLRALEVKAAGGVSYDGKRWQSPGLEVIMGANRLHAQGALSDTLDVQWQLAAPLLNQLDTNLHGSINTQGSIQGRFAEPQINIAMQASALKWQDFSLQDLQLSLAPDTAGIYQLQLTASELAVAQQQLREINLSGSGSLADHNLKAKIDAPAYGKLNFSLASGYQSGQWRGQLTQLNVNLLKLPRWRLLRAQPMLATQSGFEFGEICLAPRRGGARNNASQTLEDKAKKVVDDKSATNPSDSDDEQDSQTYEPELTVAEVEQAAICAQGQWQDTTGLQLKAQLNAVPLRQLRAFLKPDVSLAGVIDGEFELKMPIDKTPLAHWQLQTREGELHYQYADQPPETFVWQSAVLSGAWQAQQITSELVTDWGKFGRAQADISLQTASQALAGKAHINFGDLSPIAAFLPMADDLHGQLAADFELHGSLAEPQLLGQLNLLQGSVKIPRLGLALSDISLALKSYGDRRVELQSHFKSGEGTLEISGDAEQVGTPEWQLKGKISGDNFELVDETQIMANISPAIELRANQQEIHLTGTALIPSARATIKALPAAATKVSDDVIIDTQNASAKADTAIPAVYVNVSAELGDKVHFNGFGLTSRLSGKMKLLKTPARAFLTTGYVDVVDGKYKAYGQELTIQRGRLIFQGPYENPGLDIRAERTLRGTEGDIVGLQIGGTLQRPTSSVYSNPALENEGEAMALLLTGKPLSEATAGDAYLIISAMSGLGMDQGGSITGSIASAFSLDELKISADDGLEHSSLWVGKYLTERLFVRYIIGLFDDMSKLVVSYQMTDRLRLEAESGEVQSVDMIYKIER